MPFVGSKYLMRHFRPCHVEADGHCMFRAVAAALLHAAHKRAARQTSVARILRKKSTAMLGGDHLLANSNMTGKQVLQQFLPSGQSTNAYCRLMKAWDKAEWADEPHLLALAHVVRRKIIVYDIKSADKALRLTYGVGRPSIRLYRIHDVHYGALLPRDRPAAHVS